MESPILDIVKTLAEQYHKSYSEYLTAIVNAEEQFNIPAPPKDYSDIITSYLNKLA